MTPPESSIESDPPGGFIWRLRWLEDGLKELTGRVDGQYKDLIDTGNRRHDENRDKLTAVTRQLDRLANEHEHLSKTAERLAKLGWGVLTALIVIIVIAVLRLVGPSLDPAHAESVQPGLSSPLQHQ